MTVPADPGGPPTGDNAPNRRRPSLRTVLRAVLGLAAVVLLVVALVRAWPQVSDDLRHVPAALAGAVALGLLAQVFAGLAYRELLADQVRSHRDAAALPDIPRAVVLPDFFLGQLAKYLPGGVWSVVAQADLAGDLGIPRGRAAGASLVTLASTAALGGALGLGGAAAGVLAEPDPWLRVLAALGAVLLLAAALVPGLFGVALGVTGRVARRDLGDRPSARALFVAAALNTATWACFGLHLVVLGSAVGGPAPWAVATVAFAAAWVLGMVAVVLPAGLGVRDAVLAGLLAPWSPSTAAAVVVALGSRFTLVVADALLAGTGAALRRRRTHRLASGPS